MRMKTLQSESGFTLIEALIAMVVLSLGIFALYSMQLNSVRGNSRASRLTTASTWNADQLEKIVGMQYSDTDLQDTDGDGTNKDSNGDGIDDSGGGANFGLDDATTATADKTASSPDGRYTIYWNVAVDVPLEQLKTIRVHVQDNRQVLSRPVTFTYIKAEII